MAQTKTPRPRKRRSVLSPTICAMCRILAIMPCTAGASSSSRPVYLVETQADQGLVLLFRAADVLSGSPDEGYLDTKVDIGAYFALHKGMSDVDNASSAMALFGDQDASTTTSALAAIDSYHADALDPDTGEFLMPLVGVLDDPFAMA